MRRLLPLFLLCVFFSQLGLSAQVHMPAIYGRHETKQVVTTETFYDSGGPTKNAHPLGIAAVTFTPKYGQAIEVDFSELDLKQATLYVYEGKQELVKSEGGDEDDEITYTKPNVPELYVLRGSDLSRQVFHSTTADGALTFVFIGANPAGKGWTAEVKSVAKTSDDTPVPAEPEGSVYMVPGPREVIVGSTGLDFYDDGGPTKKISPNFEGYVTFVPKQAGQRIRVTFTSLKLFHTYKPKNDLLRVYNGRSTSSTKLLRELLNEQTPISLISSEDDGSLTVSLKSVTGTPQDGFVARVEAITPEPMTFASASATSPTEKVKSAAGEHDKPLLLLTLHTEGVSPALTLSELELSTQGTSTGALERLILYRGEQALTTNRIGEATVTGDQVRLQLSAPLELNYGDNTFLLTGDISAKAHTGDQLSLTARTAVLSGETKQLNLPTPTPYILDNVCRSREGQPQVITVYSDWTFAPTMSAGRYAPGNTDQVTTFLPAKTGEVVELDFQSFDVLYEKSKYGTKAVFEIYAGQGRTGKLLWRLDEETMNAGGPKLIHSTSSDGALTVVFNPKESIPGRQKSGWQATVRSQQPQPMGLVSATVAQASTAEAPVGATGLEFLDLTLETKGSLQPKKLEAIKLQLKGAPQAFSKLYLYALSSPKAYSSAKLLGSVTPTGETTVTLPLTVAQTLPERKSYYYIAADIAQGVAAGLTLDLALPEITLSGETVSIESPDPEGGRITRNLLSMAAGETTIEVTNPLSFYDNGGPTGKYPRSFTGTVHFVPRAGEVIHCRIRQLRLGRVDYLSFYHGKEANEDKLITKLSGYKRDLPELISTAPDGSMTVTFTSKTSDDGWDIEVSSERPIPLHVTEVKAEAIQDTRLMRGAKDVPLMKLAVTVTGDQGALSIEHIDFAPFFAQGSRAWAKLNLYATETSEAFSTAKLYATGGERFSGTTDYHKPGTYYFFLAADVDATAPTGARITITPRSITAGGEERAITTPPTAAIDLHEGMHGDFTIGERRGMHYTTLIAAIKDLVSRGVDGPVRLLLSAGTYDEALSLPDIAGLSETNTLTIEPISGRRGEVTLTNTHYRKVDYGDNKPGYFNVEGADYVTLRALTFTSEKSDAPALLLVRNGSQHLTIDDCELSAPRTTLYNEGDMALIRTARGNQPSPNNDFLTLRNSHLIGGYSAIYADGLSNVALPTQRVITIEGNTLEGQGSKSIYLRCIPDMTVRANRILASGKAARDYQAMDLTLGEGVSVVGNRIHLTDFSETTTAVQAIYLRRTTEHAQIEHKSSLFASNEIILDAPQSLREVYAFYFTDEDLTDIKLLHNSVLISGTRTDKSTAPVYFHSRKQGTISKLEVKNNLWQNLTPGSIYKTTAKITLVDPTFTDNVSYTAGSDFALLGDSALDLAEWTSRMKDTSSRIARVDFAAPRESLLPQEFSALTFARALPEVPTDIVGTKHPATDAAVGAYEATTHGFPALATGYPKPLNLTADHPVLEIKATDFGQFFCLVLKQSDTAPTLEALKASTLQVNLYPNQVSRLTLPALDGHSAYRLYLLPRNLSGQFASAALTYDFSTDALPSEVADFESVAIGTSDFVSGTYRFVGGKVYEPQKPYTTGSHRALECSRTVTITPTHTAAPTKLTGFYLQSDAPVRLTAKGGADGDQTKTLPSTGGVWRYVSLRDLGELTELTIQSEGKAGIDDFTAEPQPLRLTPKTFTSRAGETIALQHDAEGGVWPYSYVWRTAAGEVVGKEATYSMKAERTQHMTLEVTDAWEQKVKSQLLLKVSGGKPAIATFDDLGLEPETAWYGEQEAGGSDFISSTFYSGSYSFACSNAPALRTWMGFAYSDQTKTTFTSLFPDQFNSAVGHGVNGSKNYAVAYAYRQPAELRTTHAGPAVIPGTYVTNTAWVKQVTQTGTKMGSEPDAPFHQGDYLLLIASNSTGTKSLEIPLIDYRSTDPKEHYTIDTWQWVDLSALGETDIVRFTMKGSRVANGGTTIPAYFCLDDFGSEVPAKDIAPRTLAPQSTETLDLTKIFTDASLAPSASPRPVYTLMAAGSEETVTATLSGSNLRLTAKATGSTSLIISQRQGGKTVYLRLPLTVALPQPTPQPTPDPTPQPTPQPTPTPEADGELKAYPSPATTEIHLTVSGRVDIFSLTGQLMLTIEHYTAGQAIPIGNLPAGMYLARTPQGVVRFSKR